MSIDDSHQDIPEESPKVEVPSNGLMPDKNVGSKQDKEQEQENLLRPQLKLDSPLRMVETAFLASTGSLIWFINFYFPFGALLRIFFPIPIALVYLRWGKRAAWMSALVSGLLLSVLMGPIRSSLFVMPFGFMGVLLGATWRRRVPWSVSITLASILGTIGVFFRLWLLSLLSGEDLWVYSVNQVTEIIEWIFLRLGLLTSPSVFLVQIGAIALIVVNNFLYIFLMHIAAWLLLDRLGNPIPRPPQWVQVIMDYEG